MDLKHRMRAASVLLHSSELYAARLLKPSPAGLVLTHIYCPERTRHARSSTSLVNVANHARGSASRDCRLPCAPRTRLSPPPRARTGPLSSDELIRLVPGSRFLRALAPLHRSPAYPGLCGRECET